MLISDGAVAPLSLADSSPSPAYQNYYPNGGLGLTAQFSSYAEIYKRQLWVAVLVNKVAAAASRLPFKVYRKGDAGRTDASDTPLGRLMAQPNSRHDPVFFWNWTVSTFEIYGESLWLKVRPAPGRPPVQLLPLHPANVYTRRLSEQDEKDGKGRAGSLVYVFHMGSAAVPVFEFPEQDIVHFRSYNPDNLVRGLSRLEPLRQTLINEDAARRSTSSFWLRGARPGFLLKHPKSLSDGVGARLAAQFDAKASGADRTGATVVLEEGMEAQTLDITAEDAQYIETRKLNREEACAVYDVPPPVVHILDRATFSNITEQMRSMYRDTMAPRLGMYESTLRAQLYTDFDSDLYGEFLMEEVLRGSFEARATAYQQADYMTMAEKREAENLPYIPGTERIFVNAATVPLDAASLGQVGGLIRAGFEPEAALAALGLPAITHTGNLPVTVQAEEVSPVTVRSVMGRLGNVKALAEIDPGRLTAGLNGDTATVLAALDAAVMAGDSVPEFRGRLKALAGKDT